MNMQNIIYIYTSELVGDVFNGNDGLSGKKLFSFEGGARIPFIVRYPGDPQAGTVCDHILANYDTMATKLLKACDGNMYHGTWENHKAVRVDELPNGSGPEDAFPSFERWRVE